MGIKKEEEDEQFPILPRPSSHSDLIFHSLPFSTPPNMAVPPIRLLRPSAMTIDAEIPCVLEIGIPTTLPHRLDPSLPAPPYHPGTITAEEFRDSYAMPLLRRLVAQIVSHLFGPEHATAALEAPPGPPLRPATCVSWPHGT